jgi:soluble lytic murein transglycosylase-like protein
MAALKVVLAAGALFWAAPGAADPLDIWSSYIDEASVRFGVPVEWIRRVMRAESGGRTSMAGKPIVSRAGAMGLMQLMPGTWRQMRAIHGLGRDPHDPRDNILAGTAYLRAMHDRFGYPGLFAAYNAGSARHAEHLATGRGLPAETVAYVAKVTGSGARHGAGAARGAEPAVAPLFFMRASTDRREEPIAGETVSDGLFVPLDGQGR